MWAHALDSNNKPHTPPINTTSTTGLHRTHWADGGCFLLCGGGYGLCEEAGTQITAPAQRTTDVSLISSMDMSRSFLLRVSFLILFVAAGSAVHGLTINEAVLEDLKLVQEHVKEQAPVR